MITTGKFKQKLPNSKSTTVELSDFFIPRLEYAEAAETKEIKINGTGEQNISILLEPANQFGKYYSIKLSGENIFADISSKVLDTVKAEEKINFKLESQGEKFGFSINESFIVGGDFLGGITGLEISGSGLNFDKKIKIPTPDVRLSIPALGSLESRNTLIEIKADKNLNVNITGIKLSITNNNGFNIETTAPTNIDLSRNSSDINITKNNTIGISGLLTNPSAFSKTANNNISIRQSR